MTKDTKKMLWHGCAFVKKLSLIRNVILNHVWRLPIQILSACCFWRIHKKRRLAKKVAQGQIDGLRPFCHFCISALLKIIFIAFLLYYTVYREERQNYKRQREHDVQQRSQTGFKLKILLLGNWSARRSRNDLLM